MDGTIVTLNLLGAQTSLKAFPSNMGFWNS